MFSNQGLTPARSPRRHSSNYSQKGWTTTSFILVALPVTMFLAVIVMIFISINSDLFSEKYENIDGKLKHLRGPTGLFRSFPAIIPILENQQEKKKPAPIIPTHLIMVPGHAAMHIERLPSADHSDEAWYLLSYQKNQGYPKIIASHIERSIELVRNDTNALLLFSGGQTRHDVGPISEAASYYYLGEYKHWIDHKLQERIFLEEFARDSFENFLFSICRFYEITHDYPTHITIIGFDFKKDRYLQLHRKALQYPEENITYIAMKASDPFDQEHAEEGEKLAYEEFVHDLYGCNDHALREKRFIRNPFHRSIPYTLSCPEMKALLEWCGSSLIDPKHIPWLPSSSAPPVS